MRIEVIGCMASGKTTLCKTMQKMGLDILLEPYEKNPFLTDFYYNYNSTFENQMFFLLQHYNSIMKYNGICQRLICDFSLALDYVYASVLLTEQELKLHSQLLSYILSKIGHSDFTIKLVCPDKVILQRIADRNRDFEQEIDFNFVKQLNNEIDKYIVKSKCLVIDSSQINFMDESVVYNEIIKKMQIMI